MKCYIVEESTESVTEVQCFQHKHAEGIVHMQKGHDLNTL